MAWSFGLNALKKDLSHGNGEVKIGLIEETFLMLLEGIIPKRLQARYTVILSAIFL